MLLPLMLMTSPDNCRYGWLRLRGFHCNVAAAYCTRWYPGVTADCQKIAPLPAAKVCRKTSHVHAFVSWKSHFHYEPTSHWGICPTSLNSFWIPTRFMSQRDTVKCLKLRLLKKFHPRALSESVSGCVTKERKKHTATHIKRKHSQFKLLQLIKCAV